jgi:drug/metabolite transporter (DMT)-like permease
MNRLLSPLFVLLWSSGFLVGGLGTRALPPFTLTALRLTLAMLLVAAVAVLTRAPWPRTWPQWRDLVITGALLQGVQFGGAYSALALGVPAALVSLVLCLSPVLVALASGPVLGEHLGRLGVLGSVLAVVGALVAGVEHVGDGGSLPAMGLLLVGLVGFAGGTLYQKKRGAAMDLRTGTAVQLLAGVAVVVPMAFLVEGGLRLPTTALGVGSVLWLAIANSIGAVVLLFVLLRRGTGASVSGLLYLVPAVTALLAVPVLGQPIGWETLAGLVITLSGVALLSRDGRQAPTPTRATAAAARQP